MRRRGLPARRDRGPRLQRRDPRAEGLQRRRHSRQAALRGRARPAGRRERRAVALHRGGHSDRGRRARLASIYLPNGNPAPGEKYDYKLAFMDRLIRHARKLLTLEEPLALAGDFNVIPEPRDAAHPEQWVQRRALFCRRPAPSSASCWRSASPTRCARSATTAGLYTFWDYQAGGWQRNNGIRIDHVLLSPQAADRLASVAIDKDMRGAREGLGPCAAAGDAAAVSRGHGRAAGCGARAPFSVAPVCLQPSARNFSAALSEGPAPLTARTVYTVFMKYIRRPFIALAATLDFARPADRWARAGRRGPSP